jgi:uncharacterized protein YjaZ
VLDVTGAQGEASASAVYWTVDPSRAEGVANIADVWLRQTLAHELSHLVRFRSVGPSSTLLDRVVSEGLATALERDFSDSGSVPWGHYPEDVDTWAADMMALPRDTTPEDWLASQSAEQRWAIHKTGTYLVDRAARASGLSAAEMVGMPTDEIVRMAMEVAQERL